MHSGKVRDIYEIDSEKLLMVTSDRLSAFDVVLMNGAGPNHIHPEGEIDLCFPFDGNPKFDGQEPGWVVYGAGSQHIPTVSGGTMAIVYLLPKGAFELVEG